MWWNKKKEKTETEKVVYCDNNDCAFFMETELIKYIERNFPNCRWQTSSEPKNGWFAEYGPIPCCSCTRFKGIDFYKKVENDFSQVGWHECASTTGDWICDTCGRNMRE